MYNRLILAPFSLTIHSNTKKANKRPTKSAKQQRDDEYVVFTTVLRSACETLTWLPAHWNSE